MTLPTVTVAIPTHNRHDLLLRAIASVRAQTRQPASIVVVDDCSEPAIEDLDGGFLPIELVRLATGSGAAAARNLAMDLARTPVIAFLDSDDWWSADHLARQSAEMTPGTVASYAAVRKVRAWRSRPGADPGPVGDITTAMLAGWSISTTSSLMVSTAAARDVRFDEFLTGLQDYDFLLRLSQHGTVAHASTAITYFDQHDGERLSTAFQRRLTGITAVRRKHAEAARARGVEDKFHAFLDREYARAFAEAQSAHASTPLANAVRAAQLLRHGTREVGTDRPVALGGREAAKVLLGQSGLAWTRRLLWSSFTTSAVPEHDRPDR